MRWDGKNWLRWVRGIDWQDKLGGHLADRDGGRSHLLDPDFDGGALLGATLLFLEAGLREVEDQLGRVGRANPDSLGCGGIAKDLVLKRARDLQKGLPDGHPWKYGHVGRGAFDHRWCTVGAFHRSFVVYSLHAPRWRDALDVPARMARKLLPDVAAGKRTLLSVVDQAARTDLRLRIRLAKYFAWQLGYIADAHWQSVAHAAHAEFDRRHTARWAPVYDEAVEVLGIGYRPGWNGVKLAGLIAPLAMGLAVAAAGSGDEGYLYDEDGELRLTVGICAFVRCAVDAGDRPDLLAG